MTGPGKGMYSRLYTNVLNQYSYLDSALAVNLSYADTGLFYIQFSCLPAQVSVRSHWFGILTGVRC